MKSNISSIKYLQQYLYYSSYFPFYCLKMIFFVECIRNQTKFVFKYLIFDRLIPGYHRYLILSLTAKILKLKIENIIILILSLSVTIRCLRLTRNLNKIKSVFGDYEFSTIFCGVFRLKTRSFVHNILLRYLMVIEFSESDDNTLDFCIHNYTCIIFVTMKKCFQ